MNDSASRETIYESARAAALTGWWPWALAVGGIATVLWLCVRHYRGDVHEQSSATASTLIILRLVTIFGLVFFFFDLQRRTQQMIERPSEAVVLVDTSQSMSLPATADGPTDRVTRVSELLSDSELLDELSDQHRVSVYAVGETVEPTLIAALEYEPPADQPEPDEAAEASPASRVPAIFAAALIAVGGLLTVVSLIAGAFGRTDFADAITLATVLTLLPGVALLGGVAAVRSEWSLPMLLGASPPPVEPAEDEAEDLPDRDESTDWAAAIAANAPESRIGDAIRAVLALHDSATLSGVVLLTDGQNNGGADLRSATAAARRGEVALYPVGIGSSDPPINVRVVDLDAPRRVYPGDKFAVTAVIQGSGPRPIDVDVQLLDGLDNDPRSADGVTGPPANVIETQSLRLDNDGTLSGIRFEMEPESVGRRRLAVRVLPPPDDRNERDDLRDARYEVVARKLRVLAIAGGPTREYRFVRNLLHRDESVELDVWLQTGRPGMSQDAAAVLQSFPSTPEELFAYDAILLFDPDWLAIDAAGIDLLDRWLSRQAGGMILVGGPVYHPRWIRRRTDPRTGTVAGFYPVRFASGSPLIGVGRSGGENAWPLDLTAEAKRAEFLWIEEDPAASFAAWRNFDGVYDFVEAKSAKPGAKVYAYFSDPTTEISGSLPIYMASQFYGAGRVYFQGSGEMWRLRGEGDDRFDAYYTKLVRWVSEGRLLRDSNRGVLLVDNSKAMLGDTITVRAVLSNDQFEPLDAPEVTAKVLAPGGSISDLKLRPLEGEPRAGTYGGRLRVREAGSYEIRLTLGDALDEEVLRQTVQVRLPTIELERPRRNDEELKQMATMTGGEYLPIDATTADQSLRTSLIRLLRPQPQTTILPGTPDVEFARRRNAALLWLIATALAMEWVVRRLHRLA